MSTPTAQTDAIVASLQTLKRQFESGAEKYPLLSCLLVVEPDSDRQKLRKTFPVQDCRTHNHSLCMDHATGDYYARHVREPSAAPSVLTIQVWPAHPFYAFQARYLYIRSWSGDAAEHRSYLAGRDIFKNLATLAGQKIFDLPASFLNSIVPPELKPLCDEFVDPRPKQVLRLGRVPGCKEPVLMEGPGTDALMPAGRDADDRWVSLLAWLAWSGLHSKPFSATRQTWFESPGKVSIYPWYGDRETFASRSDEFRPFGDGPEVTFENSRHYFSVLDNVFLCSAMAIDFVVNTTSADTAGERTRETLHTVKSVDGRTEDRKYSDGEAIDPATEKKYRAILKDRDKRIKGAPYAQTINELGKRGVVITKQEIKSANDWRNAKIKRGTWHD